MNCCDSFGRCTNGDNCPVRRANSMPIQHNSDGSDPGLPVVMFPSAKHWLQDMLYSLVDLCLWPSAVVVGAALGYGLWRWVS